MESTKKRNWVQQRAMIKELYPSITDEDLTCELGTEAAMLKRIAAKVLISEEALNAILGDTTPDEDLTSPVS
jgi:hypothetical protein